MKRYIINNYELLASVLVLVLVGDLILGAHYVDWVLLAILLYKWLPAFKMECRECKGNLSYDFFDAEHDINVWK